MGQPNTCARRRNQRSNRLARTGRARRAWNHGLEVGAGVASEQTDTRVGDAASTSEWSLGLGDQLRCAFHGVTIASLFVGVWKRGAEVPDRNRVVSIAKLSRRAGQTNLFEADLRTDILRALSPEFRTDRYGRRWRFSRWVDLDGRFVAAKLGYERVRETEAVHYDDVLEDYVTELRPNEVVSFCHFVVDLENQFVAFDERPPDIRRQSFIGAFRALLRTSLYRLNIELVTDSAAFDEWVRTVRLVRFSARLEQPNPKWRDDVGEIRALLEGTGADEISLIAQVENARADAQLIVEDSIIREATTYARDGHARYRAVGISEGSRRHFQSVQHVPSMEIIETDDDTSDSIWEKVRVALIELILPFL
jgi:hypothetical protein